MELRLQEQSMYLIALLMLASSTTKASNVVDVGGKSLSRGTDKGMAYAKFKAHKFSYLNITSIGSDMVAKGSECGIACVNISSCFSFNLAAFFDINTGRILCELLPSDKYNNSKKFVTSQFYHHYSIASPCSSSPCQNNGMCAAQYEKNTYVCVCAKGYTAKHCETDVDECSASISVCGVNAKCTNTRGSYRCSCKAGFTGDGKTCSDVDECNASVSVCDVNAYCQNTRGSYCCTCKAGFTGDGKTCSDVDECSASVSVCDINANCQNTRGSYRCSCKPGFTGDGKTSSDLDECNTNSHGCHGNADCQNTVGSYKCTCKAGYTGDGKKNCYHSVSECNSYSTLAGADRKVTYSGGNTALCDNALTGWYRFVGAAGTKMAASPPGTHKCGTNAAGWLKGAHPTVAEGQVTRQVCYQFNSNNCEWQTSIAVRNCGSFFVYNLKSPPNCNMRYCGSD